MNVIVRLVTRLRHRFHLRTQLLIFEATMHGQSDTASCKACNKSYILNTWIFHLDGKQAHCPGCHTKGSFRGLEVNHPSVKRSEVCAICDFPERSSADTHVEVASTSQFDTGTCKGCNGSYLLSTWIFHFDGRRAHCPGCNARGSFPDLELDHPCVSLSDVCAICNYSERDLADTHTEVTRISERCADLAGANLANAVMAGATERMHSKREGTILSGSRKTPPRPQCTEDDRQTPSGSCPPSSNAPEGLRSKPSTPCIPNAESGEFQPMLTPAQPALTPPTMPCLDTMSTVDTQINEYMLSLSQKLKKLSKDDRRRIAEDTIARTHSIIEGKLIATWKSVFYEHQLPPYLRPLRFVAPVVATKLIFCHGDIVTTLVQLFRDEPSLPSKTAVLNMAADDEVAGGFSRRYGTTQEDALCYSSTLYSLLDRQRDCYPFDSRCSIDPSRCQGIYSPAAVLFKTGLLEGCTDLPADERNCFAVISVSAPKSLEKPASRQELSEKIRFICRIAMHNNKTILFLGALGCGAYNLSAIAVAATTRKVLCEHEFLAAFERVYVVIYARETYDAFKTEFSG